MSMCKLEKVVDNYSVLFQYLENYDKSEMKNYFSENQKYKN